MEQVTGDRVPSLQTMSADASEENRIAFLFPAEPNGNAVMHRATASQAGLLIAGAIGLAIVVHSPHVIFNRADTNLDFFAHYRWALEVSQAMASGDIYPRWMSAANYGLGEPALLYYSPLYFLLAGAIRLGMPNVWLSMQIVEMLSTLVVGAFSWLILRRQVGTSGALLGTIGCIAAPMVVMLFHYFNGFPWATSTAAFMALLWSILRFDFSLRRVNLAGIIALGTLVALHVVSALMTLICLSAVLARTLFKHRDTRMRVRVLVSWVLLVVVGLLLAGAYLVPAVGSTRYINADVWSQVFTPFNAFSFPIVTSASHGIKWFGFQWPISLLALLTTLTATIYVLRKPEVMGDALEDVETLIIASWCALFFASELSYPFWMFDTPLRKIQFPFRFIYVAGLTGILAATIVGARAWNHRRLDAALIVAPVLVSVGLGFALTAKAAFYEGERLDLSTDRLLPYSGLAEYETRSKGLAWKMYVDQGLFDGECRRINAVCSEGRRKGRGFEWDLTLSVPATLRLPAFDFPAWEVLLDGDPIPHDSDPDSGLVRVLIPEGQYAVLLRWRLLPLEWVGLGGSGVAILFIGCVIWARRALRPGTEAR